MPNISQRSLHFWTLPLARVAFESDAESRLLRLPAQEDREGGAKGIGMSSGLRCQLRGRRWLRMQMSTVPLGAVGADHLLTSEVGK